MLGKVSAASLSMACSRSNVNDNGFLNLGTTCSSVRCATPSLPPLPPQLPSRLPPPVPFSILGEVCIQSPRRFWPNSMLSAPVGAADPAAPVPNPQLLWVVAYEHLAGRVPGGRERRAVPLNKGVQDKLRAADLWGRVQHHRLGHFSKAWWQTSEAALAGPYLHSLVLAQPGHFHDSHLDFEGRTLRAYFGTGVYTVRVTQVWPVASDSTTYITCCRRGHVDDSIGQLFNLKVAVACPYADYSTVRLQRASSAESCLASVLARYGVRKHDHVRMMRMVIMVEPLAALTAARRWSTIGLLPRWRLPHGSLAEQWGQSWPSAEARAHGAASVPPLQSARASISIVDQYLLERARNGDDDAGEAVLHLRALAEQFDPVERQPDEFRDHQHWSGRAVMATAVLVSNHRSTGVVSSTIDEVAPASLLSQSAGAAGVEASIWRRGGALLPLSTNMTSLSLLLLDIAYMLWRRDLHDACRHSWVTYWTADSSPIKNINWLNSGFWSVPRSRLRTLFRHVCTLVTGTCGTEGPRLTRLLMGDVRYHQLSPVALGWRNEGTSSKLSAVLWAASLESGMDSAPSRQLLKSARSWTTDMGVELGLNEYKVQDMTSLCPWLDSHAIGIGTDCAGARRGGPPAPLPQPLPRAPVQGAPLPASDSSSDLELQLDCERPAARRADQAVGPEARGECRGDRGGGGSRSNHLLRFTYCSTSEFVLLR